LIGRTHQLDLQSNFEATFWWVRGVYTKLEITRKMNSYRALEKWRRGAAAATRRRGAARRRQNSSSHPFRASLAKLFIFQLVSGTKPLPQTCRLSEQGKNNTGVCQ
jgi:hypothetical protein